MKLEIRDLELSLGDFRLECGLSLPSGRLTTLLGPSGCGKTSLLKSVAGLYPLNRGRIILGDREISTLDPRDRKIAMVFQDYALFPHMSVRRNICYGMSLKKEAALSRCRELLALVELEGFEERMPEDLSGGEKQRVALARALASEPELLLLDEPLSALDARLRRILRRQIREIQNKTGITTLYVTHDQEEAMAISDRIVLMDRGRVSQYGRPEELYRRPANAFAGRFIGSANMIPVSRAESSGKERLLLHTVWGKIALPADSISGSITPREGGYLYFRPEDARLTTDGSDSIQLKEEEIRGSGVLTYREYGGDFQLLEIKTAGAVIRLKAPYDYPCALKETLSWTVSLKDCSYLL